ncbi:hypothetical protein [Bordetella petrii]|uniref:hypothetical protein n=1 Tax=Bordetella petrii TaxID=94624 RepID=UPI001E3F0FD8|nr:hypothetical protein [Bordetella petrii]
MPNCTIKRTHHLGRALQHRDWEAVPGPVMMYSIFREDMKREVQCFKVMRRDAGAMLPSPIPDLMDVELLTFSTDRAMMVRGFEEVRGTRFYQGWYIEWTR